MPATARRRRSPWLLLPAAALGVAGLCWWAWQTRPPASFIRAVRGMPMLSLPAATDPERPPPPTADWRLYVTWDAGLRGPGAPWVLGEGQRAGDGYELHWLGEGMAFQVIRGGAQPTLLAAVPVAAPPQEVRWRRQGMRIGVQIDGRDAVDLIDAEAPPPVLWWTFATPTIRDEVEITLHVDRAPDDPLHLPVDDDADRLAGLLGRDPPAPPRQRWWQQMTGLIGGAPDPPDREPLRLRHAAARARAALRTDPEDQPALIRAIGLANAALGDGGAGPWQRDQLRRSLAVAEIRGLLAAAAGRPGAAELAGEPGQADADLIDRDQALAIRVGESLDGLLLAGLAGEPGTAIGLADALVERGTRRPQLPSYLAGLPRPLAEEATRAALHPAAVWRRRQQWLGAALRIIAPIEQAAPGGMSADQRRLLALAAHGLRCVLGQPSSATPADAPGWMTARWRLFAGTDPQVDRLDPLPDGAHLPLAATIGRLLALVAAEPVAAAAATARLRRAAAEGRDDLASLSAAAEPLPPPGMAVEADLIRALIVLRAQARGGAGRDEAALDEARRKALEALAAGATPWNWQDPLAYALHSLLRARAAAGAGTGAPIVRGAGLAARDRPDLLVNYANLLRGLPGDERQIWATIPPERALLTVLAIQEAEPAPGQRIAPDWSLLDCLPCRNLPVEFARPPAAAPAGPGSAGPAP